MKISGDKLIEVYHTWLKDYFSNVRLTSSKVNWLKLPLAKNAPVSPIYIVFLLKNVANEIKAFRSLVKISDYKLIQNIFALIISKQISL